MKKGAVVKTIFNLILAVFAAWWIQHLGGTTADQYLVAVATFAYNDLRDSIEKRIG